MSSLVSLSLTLVLLLGASGKKPALTAEQALEKAKVGGKYSVLLKKIEVEEDFETYSAFRDFGLWSGTGYRKYRDLPAGYWVYVWPHWYIWQKSRDAKVTPPPLRLQPPIRLLPPSRLEVTPRFDWDGRIQLVPGIAAKRSWGPEQATGAPDTPRAGDYRTAWASKTPDDREEWLELEYAAEVAPIAVIVYETYNPGALVRVTGIGANRREREVWRGKDPVGGGAKMGIAVIPVPKTFPMKRVRLTFDSKRVEGWNEIDAVGLLDAKGKTHWAVGAKASSFYGEAAAPGMIRWPGVDTADQRIARLEAEVARLKAAIERLTKAIADRRPPPGPARPAESAMGTGDPVLDGYPEAFFLRCYKAAGVAPEQVKVGPARKRGDRKNQWTDSFMEVDIAAITAEQARKFLKTVESASPRVRVLELSMRRTRTKTQDDLFDAKFRIGSRSGPAGAIPVRSALATWEAFRASAEGVEIEGLHVHSLEISTKIATVKGLLKNRGDLDLLDQAMRKQDFVARVERGRTTIDPKSGLASFSLSATLE